MRYELADFEWAAIESFLPNKPRGIPRISDRWSLSPRSPKARLGGGGRTTDVLPDGLFDLPDGQIT